MTESEDPLPSDPLPHKRGDISCYGNAMALGETL